MRALLRFMVRCLYRFQTFGADVLNTPGPVLLIPNHVSWLDWLFLWVSLDEDWRFVTSSATAQISWLHRRVMVNRYTYPIDMNSPYAIKHMTEFLQRGGRLVLFAEGRISLTGSLMKLFEGTGFLLHKSHARVITCYLRGAARIPFVRHRGWTRLFPKVTAHFSALLTPPPLEHASTAIARTRLTTWLHDELLRQQFQTEMEHGPSTVLGAIAETAALRPSFVILEDLSRQELTCRRLFTAVRLLHHAWNSLLDPSFGQRIGVLLPNVNGCPVTLLSLWAAQKVPAILNYSSGVPTMIHCAKLAELKVIITSRVFLERAHIPPQPFVEAGYQLIFLEDVRARIGRFDRLTALLTQTFQPWRDRSVPDRNAPAVCLFTSGSEGVPKGVELTQRNLLSNVRQMLTVIDLEDADRLFNALPLFHSFGLTVGTLLPLIRGIYLFLYPSPLHYRVIPSAVYDRACTIFLGTNTFLNGYARRAHPYDFRAVRYLFAGAEKVQENTASFYARHFGIRILEGYGATECSPCLSVNTPLEPRYGSAGRFLPGVEHKLVPVDGVQRGGRLFVRGPNIMRGYLNPDENAKFLAHQGWYDTGDIVDVDAGGFVHILGRLKRFAKISGEMVSLTAVEEALAGAFPQFPKCEIAIISQPDPDKGEALVAVTNETCLRLDDLRVILRNRGLPNLCLPRQIRVVPEIPKLGSGKVNYRAL